MLRYRFKSKMFFTLINIVNGEKHYYLIITMITVHSFAGWLVPAHHRRICVDLPTHTRIGVDRPTHTRIGVDLPTHTRICVDLPTHTRIGVDLPTHTRICLYIPTHTSISYVANMRSEVINKTESPGKPLPTFVGLSPMHAAFMIDKFPLCDES